MAFTVRNDVHVEELGDAYLVLVPDDERVYQLEGDQAEAFALARDGAKSVPEHLTTAMAGLVELGLVETKDWSRRKVLQMGGAAAAAAVVMLNMPSVAAAGSAVTIQYLLVGAGGSGGTGGGGAGEYLEGATAAATNLGGTYTVSVGAGGLPSMFNYVNSVLGINQDLPNTGGTGGPTSITGPSAFGTKSTKGGGGGGGSLIASGTFPGKRTNPGLPGGSGGGGGTDTQGLGDPGSNGAGGAGQPTAPGKGNNGGSGGRGWATSQVNGVGGGGGGAGAVGANWVMISAIPNPLPTAPSTTVSAGGAGLASPLATTWSNNLPAEPAPPAPPDVARPTPTLYVGEKSGSSWYVAGGGGGSGTAGAGVGGLGGGGDGATTGSPAADPPPYVPVVTALQNTGGGGAGGGAASNGIVIVAITPYDHVTVPANPNVTTKQIGQTMYVLFTNSATQPSGTPPVSNTPPSTPPNQTYTFTVT